MKTNDLRAEDSFSIEVVIPRAQTSRDTGTTMVSITGGSINE
jgi:hypothetical protein